jgi:hypothetical protein
MQKSLEIVIGPDGQCCEYELLLRFTGQLTGSRVLEAMGEDNFGWNLQTVRALERILSHARVSSNHKEFLSAVACVGEFTRCYVGGDWVYEQGVAPPLNGEGIEPGDVQIRLAREHLPSKTVLTQEMPEGALFDPFQSVIDWKAGRVLSPFTPLFEIVGLPPDVPSIPAVFIPLPVMPMPEKGRKKKKKSR